MSEQDKLSLLFLFVFFLGGLGAISLIPERSNRDQWRESSRKAAPPTAGKTKQRHSTAPAESYDNTVQRDKKRPDRVHAQGSQTPEVRPDAPQGISDWLTEDDKKRARGKVWDISVSGLQTTFSQHREELTSCYRKWLTGGTGPPGAFTLSLRLETLFGEPYAVVQAATILEVTSEKRTMERCIERILAGVLFKPPPGDVINVNIPMNFSTVKTQTAFK